jgi:putative oxidoreductase
MVAAGVETALLAVSRALFGGVIAFMGLNHFTQLEQMSGYAEFKGLPAPKLSVLGSGVLLVLSGLGLVVGVFPFLSALVLAGFLLVSAIAMHDFWAVGEDDQQDEMTAFLKNVVMAGGALALAALTTETWALSLGIGL